MVSIPPWGLPLAAGVAIGFFFSGTIGRLFSSLKLPISGGHLAEAYPASVIHGPLAPSAQFPRRSFDKEYSSYLEGTVNALPTIS